MTLSHITFTFGSRLVDFGKFGAYFDSISVLTPLTVGHMIVQVLLQRAHSARSITQNEQTGPNIVENKTMDELDRKIIALLQLDGRASNAKIAREVGVSEGTVRRRLRRLVLDDVVRIIPVPNLE